MTYSGLERRVAGELPHPLIGGPGRRADGLDDARSLGPTLMLNPMPLDRARPRARRGHVIPHPGQAREAGPEAMPRSAIARRIKSWWGRNADRVHAASERLRGPARDQLIFHELADVVRVARDTTEIESALMSLACRMSGSRRAELVLESNPGAPTRRAEAIPIRTVA